MSEDTYEFIRKQFMSNFILEKRAPLGLKSLNIRTRITNPLGKGCIVDVETTGLDPQADVTLALGLLVKDKAKVYQLVKPEYQGNFQHGIQQRVREAPTPRYSYNSEFEREFLSIRDGWEDLTQHRERPGYQWENPEYDPYIRLHLTDCTTAPFTQKDILGIDVPLQWIKWLKTKNPTDLWPITFHCLCDVLRTRQLIKDE
jgi:hypothetical protein